MMKIPKLNISKDRKWDIIILVISIILSSLIIPSAIDLWKNWRGHNVDIYYDPPEGGTLFMNTNATENFEISILSDETKPVSVKFSTYTDPSDKLTTEISEEDSGIISMGAGAEPRNVNIKLTSKDGKSDVNLCFKLKDLKSGKWIVDQGDRCILIKIN